MYVFMVRKGGQRKKAPVLSTYSPEMGDGTATLLGGPIFGIKKVTAIHDHKTLVPGKRYGLLVIWSKRVSGFEFHVFPHVPSVVAVQQLVSKYGSAGRFRYHENVQCISKKDLGKLFYTPGQYTVSRKGYTRVILSSCGFSHDFVFVGKPSIADIRAACHEKLKTCKIDVGCRILEAFRCWAGEGEAKDVEFAIRDRMYRCLVVPQDVLIPSPVSGEVKPVPISTFCFDAGIIE